MLVPFLFEFTTLGMPDYQSEKKHFNNNLKLLFSYLIATLLDAAKPRPSGALMVTRVNNIIMQA